MTATEITTAPPALDTDIIHLLCCHKHNGDTCLCGEIATGPALNDKEVCCVVCLDLMAGVPHYVCPETGQPCP
jgi:hypothetical protein